MIVGTAGHIDHGKTTLVRALTGVDTDRLPEEKRRGITIELGFAPIEIAGVGVAGIVDVPGHEAFVRTMLAGATGVDLALIVIAADEGVMPQTREHLAILSLLAVPRAVVALTKSDLVEDEWLALVSEDVRATLAGTPFTDAAIVPVSATSGAGIDALRAALAEAAMTIPARDPDDLFRMPVDRAFTVKGTGTVVTGTVWSGSLAADASVRVMPSGRETRVRGIQAHGVATSRALPGARIALSLAAIDRDEVGRGAWIVSDRAWEPTRTLRADVALLDDAAALGPRTRVRFHLGTQDVGARIVAAGGALAPGAIRGARVKLDEPVVARAGDRFVLRLASPATTIGGGVVADPAPASARPRPWPPRLDEAARIDALLAEAGAAGIEARSVAVRVGIPPRRAASIAGDESGIVMIAGRLLARSALRRMGERALELVRGHHATFPLDPGLPLAALRAGLGATDAVVEAVLRELATGGGVEQDRAAVRLPGWSPTLGGDDARVAGEVRARLSAAGREPPSVAELTAAVGADPRAVLRFLERSGEVIAIDEERFYLAAQLGEMVSDLSARLEGGREYTPADLRELTGLSRKYLIPFLEYCDARGVTVRTDGGRKRSGT